MTKKEKVLEIIKRLSVVYPDPKPELNYTNAFELLVATMLAAQTTDKLVNTITPTLFKRIPTIKAMAEAPVEEIDEIIQKVNFHHNKAKNIKAAASIIMTTHNGYVPQTMAELDALPGVARKTANVVLGSAFGIAEGIIVDTHGIRLSQRLELSTEESAEKIEQDLMKIVPREHWINFGHLLTLHGRHKCIARPHTCEDCPLGNICPEYKKKG